MTPRRPRRARLARGLRARLALLVAAAVALAVAACAVASWYITRDRLYQELDRRLTAISGPLAPGDGARPGDATRPGDGPPPRPQRHTRELLGALDACTPEPTSTPVGTRPPGPYEIMQVVDAAGNACTVPNAGSLTVTAADRAAARGERGTARHDGGGVNAAGNRVDVRVLTRHFTAPDGTSAAVSFALSLDEVRGPLDGLALLLTAVAALGVLVSAGAGLAVARAALRPVDRLTGAVEHIARTGDLRTRIPDEGADEIARLGRAFNTMTAALAASDDRQRQLIADAGHELRTPLTSLRTNIDLLLRSEATGRPLAPGTRRNLLASVKAQMRELSSLVGDLLELARPAEAEPVRETVALHEVVDRAFERARLRGPGLTVRARTAPWYVSGDPASLERAVVNLLDNAVKFSPPGGGVDVRLTGDGELTVRDHGPGIPAADLPHVFERFWRSPSARSLPGSGLGLSIVARVVGESGGDVDLRPADGGGTLARVRLPGTPRPTD
ncbi:HAMP domain-containing protein [Actinomadura sp. J1-007]|uniref:sensor histidine kinase n=1 Tax=Actinomadura sp. J1-007 TaxID=2661913 RepID=UPI001328B4D0|nr:HAMP domain-containing sensor histidine kinase [Actinomadura sp. J1-007]MWK40109.1 HAMP domain-containing protein [Actinomadura sp. J1-007]